MLCDAGALVHEDVVVQVAGEDVGEVGGGWRRMGREKEFFVENKAVDIILSKGPAHRGTPTEIKSHLLAKLCQTAGTPIRHRHEKDYHHPNLPHIHREVRFLAVIVLFVFE